MDIAFGGMWYVIVKVCQGMSCHDMSWYVIVKAELLGLDIRPEHGAKLARLGEMIKVATR